MNIITIDGNHDFIIIVPTKNIKSKLAEDFITKIKSISYFNPMIIMIESSGNEFHFSKNMNLGIKHALKYSPRYIALSNDDVRPLEEDWDYNLIRKIVENKLAYISPLFIDNGGNKVGPNINMPSYSMILLFTTFYQFIPFFTFPFIRKVSTILSNKEDKIPKERTFSGIINSQPFSIFDANILKFVRGFDEEFINGCEDFELTLRIYSLGLTVGYDTTVKFLNLLSATKGKGGFSILDRRDRTHIQQIENWKTLIRKYKKHDYKRYIKFRNNIIMFS
jgi:GT2 family glycosyltransferase